MVGGLLDRANVDAVLNDLDEYAVEEALRIAEAHGGNEEGGANTVTVDFNGARACDRSCSQSLIYGCK